LVGLDHIESLRAKRRFFLRGESPDGFNDDLDVKRISFVEDIKATSVLHEAVFSCFYPAVEYIVQNSAFPSIVRDRNGQTALDLALSMKVSDLEPWQVSSVNTIIELLLQRTKLKQPDSNLPLVWEQIHLSACLVAYRESSVNPQNPSLTFVPPTYSLLQETHIQLGPRPSSPGGLTYSLDLVRFMHRPPVEASDQAANVFDDGRYTSDIKKLEDKARNLLSLYITRDGV
jgi:hypothetical protein